MSDITAAVMRKARKAHRCLWCWEGIDINAAVLRKMAINAERGTRGRLK